MIMGDALLARTLFPVMRVEEKFRFARGRVREYAESIVFYKDEGTECARVEELDGVVYHWRLEIIAAGLPLLFLRPTGSRTTCSARSPLLLANWSSAANADEIIMVICGERGRMRSP